MTVVEYAVSLLQAGLGNLAAYLAAHVLLCLVPAFFIAGGLAALVPKESVTRFLGRNAPKYVSYPGAALAGSVLAVCSCTIVPLFAGIHRKGAGLGPAIAFLFFAPAANILALAYTGVAIGGDFALARIVLSLAFGIGIGMIMALIFSRDDAAHDRATDAVFAGKGSVSRKVVFFLLLLVALLLAGTLKLGFLTGSYATFSLPIGGLDRFQELLYRLVPVDAAKGQEGVTVQGVLLIVLLALIALSSWRGLGKVDEGYNRWTWTSLALVVLTLLVAALGMAPTAAGLEVSLTGKFIGVALAMIGVFILARRLESYEVQEWLWETWRFVRQIFPLLVVGVFGVGIARQLIRPEWIESLAGRNTVIGNLVGVIFGVFMYFPTLVEVPIAKMFLSLGMHRGPLIAYIMADPELSLQSIFMVSAIIGKKKAWTYVGLVALFSTVSGLIYGTWVDGASAWQLLGYLALFLGMLAFGLYLIGRRAQREVAVAPAGK
ncbi:MAG: permease [Anaerolineae bacterium]